MSEIWKWKIQSPKPPGLVGISSNQGMVGLSYLISNEKGAVTVKAYKEAPYSDPLSKRRIIQDFVSQNHLQGAVCSYVLGSRQYTFSLLEAPKVAASELANACRWLMQEFVSFPIQDAYVDAFTLPWPRARDNQNMAYGVAMSSETLKVIEAEIEGTELQLQYIDIPELVLRNLVHCHPEEKKGSLLVRLQMDGCQMIFSKEGSFLLTRKVDLTLDSLDETKLEMFALEIQRSLDYFTATFQQSIQSLILITYDVNQFTTIENYLKKNLNTSVYPLSITQYLQCEPNLAVLEGGVGLLAVGAALRTQE